MREVDGYKVQERDGSIRFVPAHPLLCVQKTYEPCSLVPKAQREAEREAMREAVDIIDMHYCEEDEHPCLKCQALDKLRALTGMEAKP